jgi:hypothetical protein
MNHKCLVCECDLEVENDIKRSGSSIPIVYDATIWRAYGNYGSKLFDPFNNDKLEFLEACVCDSCLIKKKNLIYHIHVRKNEEIVESAPFVIDGVA